MRYFLQFFVLEQNFFFGESIELAGIFDIYVGRFWLILAHLLLFEIQKIGVFQYFWAKLATLFFKTRFWAKLVLELLKMGFLGPEDGLYQFFIHFRPFKILSFYVFFKV